MAFHCGTCSSRKVGTCRFSLGATSRFDLTILYCQMFISTSQHPAIDDQLVVLANDYSSLLTSSKLIFIGHKGRYVFRSLSCPRRIH